MEHYVSGLAALAAIQEKPFDLVILDLNLPDIDGLALCRELRRADETRRVPIIMLTARVEERDKLLGFEIGADDYITKPFSMRELLARVNAQLRRVASFETSDDEVFEDGPLRVDRARFEVRLDGERVHLTKKEFDLLWLLIRSRGRVVTRDAILARLWDYDADVETRTVDVHIRSLRRKLGDERIETVSALATIRQPVDESTEDVASSADRLQVTHASRAAVKLTARYSLLFGLLAAGVAILLMVFWEALLDRASKDRAIRRLQAEDTLVAALAEPIFRDSAVLDLLVRSSAARLRARVTAIDADGRVLPDSDVRPADVPRMENHLHRPEVIEAARTGTGSSRRLSATLDRDFVYLAERVTAGGRTLGFMRLAFPLDDLRAEESETVWWGRAAIAVSCLVLFLVGHVASRRLAMPLKRVTEATLRSRAGPEARPARRGRPGSRRVPTRCAG